MRKALIILSILLGLIYMGLISYDALSPKAKQAEKVEHSQVGHIDKNAFGLVTEYGLFKQQNDSVMEGAFLISVYQRLLLLGSTGSVLHHWQLSNETIVYGAKLLENGTVAFVSSNRGTKNTIKVVDRDGLVLWELANVGTKYLLLPNLWAFDEDENLYFSQLNTKGCLDLIRINKEKKIKWLYEIPSQFCSHTHRNFLSKESLGLRNIQYLKNTPVASGGRALAVTINNEAVVIDINSSKVVWRYKIEDGDINVFRISVNGETGMIMKSTNRASVALFNIAKNQKPEVWYDVMFGSPRADFSEMRENHLLLTDGQSRLFEVSLNKDGLGEPRWSFFLTANSTFFSIFGNSFMPKVPAWVYEQSSRH